MPRISVVIPVYGVEKYIEKCAESLFNQTLDDIEFIFVNDCTKDKSIDVLVSVLEKYPSRKNNVKIIHHEVNKGLPQARKTGVEASSGDYIVHCDSDDWVDRTMYEHLLKKAVEADADLIFCDYYIYTNDNSITRFYKNIADLSKWSIIKRLLIETSLNPAWSIMAKKTLYDNVVFPKDNQSEDRTIVIQLCWYANKIASIAEPLYYYRKNMESISNQRDSNSLINRYQASCRNADIILNFLKKKECSLDLSNEIQTFVFNLLTYLNRNLNDECALKYWKNHYPEYLNKIWKNPLISFKHKLFYYYVMTFR